jgi:hypothetical protein
MGFNKLRLPPLEELMVQIKQMGEEKYMQMAARRDALCGDPESVNWLLGKLKARVKKKESA